ncbi:ABC transporter permease [Isobaculum melis]|uniref:Peptide/nickel transport system permease protein n=1 Tax=Isobaculum melis TaxID=142588 RepID=A0A1H9RAU1_9LACT|nr:ABC transporter permease [Isobaculum melis]SER70041.1 peptide/nickel transport system permease protein [Isobaculum melis]
MASNPNVEDVIEETELDSSSSNPPLGFKVIAREFLKDKVALTALIVLVILLLTVFIGAMFIDQKEVMRVSLLNKFAPPSSEFLLGADSGGRSILGQLFLGARNSIMIGFSITVITSFVGVTLGLIAGYFGGVIDNIIMRIVDFVMILPTYMMIIVLITIVPSFTVFTFILIMSLFMWAAKTRLVRSRALSESRRDYVSASKTMGTNNFVIMFREVLPNISSIIIVNMTLNFAANIGIETGLTFLGFGLPASTPSLGTLVNYARSPEVLSARPWIWVPASLLILVLMLCINYVGQALRRAADAKQRLG